VTAAADGVVSKVSWNATGGGNVCIIDHGDIVTVYYHGAQKTKLKVGQRVEAGTFIFTSGSTGASTGDHLHFEVRRPGGKWGDTLDPEKFLPKPGETVEPAAPEPTPEPTPPTPEPPAPFVPTGHPRPTADLMTWLLKRRGK
jgi:murein DD-endopeptidase MepM/ murein hydrolase activator NlpD